MSPRAAVRLRQLGFARVYDYAGGKKDWLAAALPTEGPGYERLVSDALVRDVPTCELETPLAAALEPLDARWPCWIVVAEGRTVLGLVRPDAKGATSGEVMGPGPTIRRLSSSTHSSRSLPLARSRRCLWPTPTGGC
jgi:hypothetical protein